MVVPSRDRTKVGLTCLEYLLIAKFIKVLRRGIFQQNDNTVVSFWDSLPPPKRPAFYDVRVPSYICFL